MTINFTSTPNSYLTDRLDFILSMEEGGIPKLLPYVDNVGLITIGIGFNLADANVRSQVFASMGITDSTLISKPGRVGKGRRPCPR